jgi:MFS transporter, BCD family, chlorophyll transporter
MLLFGTVVSALLFGLLLENFSAMRLIQVVQGAAMLTLGLNLVALWKQEARDPSRTTGAGREIRFSERWAELNRDGRRHRFLVAVGLGTAAFAMQDVLLEPYGAELLGLAVAATTTLTAFQAVGALAAFALAARRLGRGADPCRLAAFGLSAVIFAAALHSALLFRSGALLIGFGAGLYAVSTLTSAMDVPHGDDSGLALGAWGAVQATAMGVGVALGGLLRDLVGALATQGALGSALAGDATGYLFVYHVEIALLFSALVALGPLVRTAAAGSRPAHPFGLAEYPG